MQAASLTQVSNTPLVNQLNYNHSTMLLKKTHPKACYLGEAKTTAVMSSEAKERNASLPGRPAAAPVSKGLHSVERYLGLCQSKAAHRF
jgi:hypothetical protein